MRDEVPAWRDVRRAGRPADDARDEVPALARRQRGLITSAQLRAAGLSTSGIERWTRAGRLRRVHRGVYRVGHDAPIPLQAEHAALLALGPAAVLSHHTASMIWGLHCDPASAVHVTLTHGRARHRDGVVVHRGSLDARDVRARDGLAVTSPVRTVHDLAPALGPAGLERMVAEAVAARLLTLGQLDGAGQPALRAVLDAGPRLTRSEAERRLLALVRQARLPLPRTNVRVAGFEVDAFWPDRRVAVEFDGFAVHGSRYAFERDRRKDLALQVAGVRVVRVSWRQLVGEPVALVAALAAVLAG